MPARLILNADDFGLTRGINRAIAELHTAGCLTSATLMATGPAFDDAVAIAKANPTLGVGCHIVLVDGTPISPPETIPTLLGEDRKNLRATLSSLLLAIQLGQVNEAEIALEATAQIERLQSAGIAITHIDTHKHTHILPRIARPLLAAAERLSVRAVRNPFEPPLSLALGRTKLSRRLQLHILRALRPSFQALLRNSNLRTTDGTIGIAATGTLNALTLHDTLAALPSSGTYELLCHPAYNDADLDAVTTRLRHHRDIEREALLAEIPKILSIPNPPQLISYADLESTNH